MFGLCRVNQRLSWRMPRPKVLVDGTVLNEVLFGFECTRVQTWVLDPLCAWIGIEVDSQRWYLASHILP